MHALKAFTALSQSVTFCEIKSLLLLIELAYDGMNPSRSGKTGAFINVYRCMTFFPPCKTSTALNYVIILALSIFSSS